MPPLTPQVELVYPSYPTPYAPLTTLTNPMLVDNPQSEDLIHFSIENTPTEPTSPNVATVPDTPATKSTYRLTDPRHFHPAAFTPPITTPTPTPTSEDPRLSFIRSRVDELKSSDLRILLDLAGLRLDSDVTTLRDRYNRYEAQSQFPELKDLVTEVDISISSVLDHQSLPMATKDHIQSIWEKLCYVPAFDSPPEPLINLLSEDPSSEYTPNPSESAPPPATEASPSASKRSMGPVTTRKPKSLRQFVLKAIGESPEAGERFFKKFTQFSQLQSAE